MKKEVFSKKIGNLEKFKVPLLSWLAAGTRWSDREKYLNENSYDTMIVELPRDVYLLYLENIFRNKGFEFAEISRWFNTENENICRDVNHLSKFLSLYKINNETEIACPPCINNTLKKARNGSMIVEDSNRLAAFFYALDLPASEMLESLSMQTQNTSYELPGCGQLKQYGICEPNIFCNSKEIHNPLEYYQKSTTEDKE